MTQYVATRWYRAPEILARLKYGVESDVWSAACIFAELLNRSFFLTGKNEIEQFQAIIRYFGNQISLIFFYFLFFLLCTCGIDLCLKKIKQNKNR